MGATGESHEVVQKRRAQNRKAQQNYRKSLKHRIQALDKVNRLLIKMCSKCWCSGLVVNWHAVESLLDQRSPDGRINDAAILSLINPAHAQDQVGEPKILETDGSFGTDIEDLMNGCVGSLTTSSGFDACSSCNNCISDEMCMQLTSNTTEQPGMDPKIGTETLTVEVMSAGADSSPMSAEGLTLRSVGSPTSIAIPTASEVSQTTSAVGTPLHQATVYAQPTVARILLGSGAEVDAVDAAGKTALLLSAESGNRELVDLLLEHGADVDLVDVTGQSALHMAATFGHGEVVRRLIQAGANMEGFASWRST